MARYFLSGLAALIWAVGAGHAGEWAFHYGPELGVDPSESYTAVYAGRNSFLVHGFGEEVNFGANFTLDTFETGGAVLETLRAGRPLKLDVLRAADRYERVIAPAQYRWKEDAAAKTVMIVFPLAVDDLLAMIEGRAVFLWADTLQFRFGLENADDALGRLVTVLSDVKK